MQAPLSRPHQPAPARGPAARPERKDSLVVCAGDRRTIGGWGCSRCIRLRPKDASAKRQDTCCCVTTGDKPPGGGKAGRRGTLRNAPGRRHRSSGSAQGLESPGHGICRGLWEQGSDKGRNPRYPVNRVGVSIRLLEPEKCAGIVLPLPVKSIIPRSDSAAGRPSVTSDCDRPLLLISGRCSSVPSQVEVEPTCPSVSTMPLPVVNPHASN